MTVIGGRGNRRKRGDSKVIWDNENRGDRGVTWDCCFFWIS